MAGRYENPITIEEAMKSIIARRFLLPAIQRKFTWTSDQICVLFDSIMRNYPINTFMFWYVKDEDVKKGFRFYQFLENYVERFGEDNPNFPTNGHGDFHAIIDGQQRLTSIYIGLKGTYASKLPRKWWPTAYDESILPKSKLYLNLSRALKEDGDDQQDEDNEQMMLHDFRFLTDQQIKELEQLNDGSFWFLVGDILDFEEVETVDKVPLKVVLPYLRKHNLSENEYALETLTRLYCAIRKEELIHYYNENNQEPNHILDIFIRTNHGGTPLSFSDILMSIMIASWGDDARQQIDELVKSVMTSPTMSFSINRDIVLKTSLMLTESDVKFRVQNVSKPQVAKIEESWPEIKSCIVETFKLIKSFGLNDHSLRAKNAAIPIAYYLFKKKLWAEINNPAKNVADRAQIQKWLNMSLLKGVFGGQSDAVLAVLRRVIKDNAESGLFPLEQIIEEYRGKNKELHFDDDFIDRLLETQKDDAGCFSILALVQSDLDYSTALDMDHLHPADAFKKSNVDGYEFLQGNPEKEAYFRDPKYWNSILNLHLLKTSRNRSKQHSSLQEWFDDSDQKNISRDDIFIDEDTSCSIEDFNKFIEKRREKLKNHLKNMTGRKTNEHNNSN